MSSNWHSAKIIGLLLVVVQPISLPRRWHESSSFGGEKRHADSKMKQILSYAIIPSDAYQCAVNYLG